VRYVELRRLNHVADQWVEKRLPALSPSSQRVSPFRLKHIKPFFGPMDVDEIRSGDVNTWLRTLTELEPKTVHNLFKELRAVINWWRRQQDREPVKWYAELPRLKENEPRWFYAAGNDEDHRRGNWTVQNLVLTGRVHRYARLRAVGTLRRGHRF